MYCPIFSAPGTRLTKNAQLPRQKGGESLRGRAAAPAPPHPTPPFPFIGIGDQGPVVVSCGRQRAKYVALWESRFRNDGIATLQNQTRQTYCLCVLQLCSPSLS